MAAVTLTMATVVKAGQNPTAPVSVASGDDGAATAAGHLLRHYSSRCLGHSENINYANEVDTLKF